MLADPTIAGLLPVPKPEEPPLDVPADGGVENGKGNGDAEMDKLFSRKRGKRRRTSEVSNARPSAPGSQQEEVAEANGDSALQETLQLIAGRASVRVKRKTKQLALAAANAADSDSDGEGAADVAASKPRKRRKGFAKS